MTFASTIEKTTVIGDEKKASGTWDAAAVITGDIDTGMTYIYDIQVKERGPAAAALTARSGVFYDETVPGSVGRAVTIHCIENASGIWIAHGKG